MAAKLVIQQRDGRTLWFAGPPRKGRLGMIVYHARTDAGKTPCVPTFKTSGDGTADPPAFSKCVRCVARAADIKRSRKSNQLAFKAG